MSACVRRSPPGIPCQLHRYAGVFLLAGVLLLGNITKAQVRELVVTATAYNSLREQTNDQPNIAAWGDRLRAGMKVIAVSRDLLDLGLTRGSVVSIQGLGDYVVLDKMNRRWRRKIDLYMGVDKPAARRWGKREVVIRWEEPDPEPPPLLIQLPASEPRSPVETRFERHSLEDLRCRGEEWDASVSLARVARGAY